MRIWLGCWNREDQPIPGGMLTYGDVVLVYCAGRLGGNGGPPNSADASGEGGLFWFETSADSVSDAEATFGPVAGVPRVRLDIDGLKDFLDAEGRQRLDNVKRPDVNCRPGQLPAISDKLSVLSKCESVNQNIIAETLMKARAMAEDKDGGR